MKPTITKAELEFLREAVNEKHSSLMSALVFDEPEHQAMPPIDHILHFPEKKPAKRKAPWGYKKDGTPKKKPGRSS